MGTCQTAWTTVTGNGATDCKTVQDAADRTTDNDCKTCNDGSHINAKACKACVAQSGCETSGTTCSSSSAGKLVCTKASVGYQLAAGSSDIATASKTASGGTESKMTEESSVLDKKVGPVPMVAVAGGGVLVLIILYCYCGGDKNKEVKVDEGLELVYDPYGQGGSEVERNKTLVIGGDEDSSDYEENRDFPLVPSSEGNNYVTRSQTSESWRE